MKNLICSICYFKHATKDDDDILVLMEPGHCNRPRNENKVCGGKLLWWDSTNNYYGVDGGGVIATKQE